MTRDSSLITAKTAPNANKKTINRITVVANRSRFDNENSVSKISATSKTDNYNQKTYQNFKDKIS